MPITANLQRVAAVIDARLVRLVADEAGGGAPQRLVDAMRHALIGGGKRFRPFLVVEAAALFGVPAERAVEAAAAVECVHCYSLVHDDLPAMDNDTLRRGRPTVWTAYDEWTAILAGDALLTLAFEIAACPACHPDPAVRNEIVTVIARSSGAAGMVGGQMLDLEADKLGRPQAPGPDHVRRLQAMKTGALIRASCELGAVLGGADAAEREALQRYGDAIGYAFQIADDLLDAEGDTATVGKAVGKDMTAGKATLVSLIGIAAARERLAGVEAEAIASLAPFGNRAAVLADAARFVARRRS